MTTRLAALCGALLACSTLGRAETGRDAWLRYAPLPDQLRARFAQLPSTVFIASTTPETASARSELIAGVRGMLGRELKTTAQLPKSDAIILCTFKELKQIAPGVFPAPHAPEGAFLLKSLPGNMIVVAGAGPRGVLYAAFSLLRHIALGRGVAGLDGYSAPAAPVRWTNEWNNLDGTIERGYAGRSIFFDNNHVVADLTRAREYARLLASVGINGCAVDNVNANPRILSPEFLPELSRLAAAFRPWGVRMVLAVPFGSPKILGGLDSFDPLDPHVVAWWKSKADEVYKAIPDLAGFVVKADSEGQAGPSAYGRTHADAANLIGRARAPHCGLLLYRGFVYDHHMDWCNPKNDRARRVGQLPHA